MTGGERNGSAREPGEPSEKDLYIQLCSDSEEHIEKQYWKGLRGMAHYNVDMILFHERLLISMP